MKQQRSYALDLIKLLLSYVIVGQLLVQLDRTNIGFAQLTMSSELAIGATAFGVASGIFALMLEANEQKRGETC